MAIWLPERDVWTRQPPFPTRIDWSNSFTKNLVFAVHGGAPWVNLAKGIPAVAHNGAIRVVGSYGASPRWASTSNSGIQMNTAPLLTSGPGTVAVYAAPAASTTRFIPLGANLGSTTPQWYLLFNANKSATTQSGTFAFARSYNGINGADYPSAVDGALHLFAATWPSVAGQNVELYVDGIAGGTNKVAFYSVPDTVANASVRDYFGGFNSSGYANDRYPLLLGLQWKRELSSEELRELSRNPWQLFE